MTSMSLSYTLSFRSISLGYMGVSLLYGYLALVLSIVMRLVLIGLVCGMSNGNGYNVAVTIHGLVMIFLMIMPSMYGSIGNLGLASMLGCNEVAYLRINNLSLLCLILGGLVLLMGTSMELLSGIGWTLYAPFSTMLSSI